MQKYAILLIVLTFSCKGTIETGNPTESYKSEVVNAPNYHLIKAKNQRGLLILFPCFPCDSENTLTEFDIEEISVKSGFSVLAMNFNQRLFLTLKEKQDLSNELIAIINEHHLPKTNIFVGGFSSGGNVSLLICDYLVKSNSQIQPKGVFIVDSPVDLLALYATAVKNIELNLSEATVEESAWIVNFFDTEFGTPNNGISDYEKNSPYTLDTQNIENLRGLKTLKIRFYTEPDLKWWRENAKNDYEDLNAFSIEKLSDNLKEEFGTNKIELIKTENQGYRKNGQKHPHSWSIVNKQELLEWMLE